MVAGRLSTARTRASLEAQRLPEISRPMLRWFTAYGRRYVRKNMHTLRVAGERNLAHLGDAPLVIYMNHPSWWDPMTALLLADEFWPTRNHYAAIDAKALERYRFFRRLGFFGIDPHSYQGAATFLNIGSQVLLGNENTLWITAQGHFSDVRERPVRLAPGLTHLLQRVDRCDVLPLAVEYAYWEERNPEALVRVGEPITIRAAVPIAEGESLHASLEHYLEAALDQLRDDSVMRNEEAFRVVLRGSAGIGGTYDWWRRIRAKLSGQTFHAEHGRKSA